MNIVHTFAQWMDLQGYGTLGTDLFIGVAPLNAPDELIWLVMGGGSNFIKSSTGMKLKSYTVSVYKRGTAQSVYDVVEQFETFINSRRCIDLPGYEVVEVECFSYPVDQDLDDEDRSVAVMEVMIRVAL